MDTEEKIVYQILKKTNGGKINDDEPVGERAIRSFMQVQRAEVITASSKHGQLAEGEEFQELGLIDLKLDFDGLTFEVPPIIQLPSYSGVKITTATGNLIPLMSRSSFMNAKANIVSGHMPKAYMLGQKIYVHEGIKGDSYMNGGDELSNFVDEIALDKKVFVEAILYNPSDAPNYDWTKSPYPLSGGLIAKMENLVISRSMGLILETPEDEVTNMKADNLRYHDQGKVD